MEDKKRLIYAEDAEKALLELRKGFRRIDEKCAVGSCILELIDVPTVDAVEVVRCQDCRCFDKTGYDEENAYEEDLSLHMGWCAEWRRGTQACRFCSYGERREGE